jgi:hypothetical protein
MSFWTTDNEMELIENPVSAFSESAEDDLLWDLSSAIIYRRAQMLLERIKEATPIGENTPHPGEAREGWYLESTTSGWSIKNDIPYVGVLVFGSTPHMITAGGSNNSYSGARALTFHDGGTTTFRQWAKQHAEPVAELRNAWEEAKVFGGFDPRSIESEIAGDVAGRGFFL